MTDFPTFRQPPFASEPQPVGHVPTTRDAHRADPQLPAPAGGPVDRVHTVMGTRRMEGSWVAPGHLKVSCIMGTVIIDFTTAVFTSPTIILELHCFLGDVKIRVPRGITATNNAGAILSDVKLNAPTVQDPMLPQLVLTGSVTMGTVTMRGPKVSLMDRIKGQF